jgi:hypothetical protein
MIASSEFDDSDGLMRDAVVGHMQRLHKACVLSAEMAMETGELQHDADAEQFSFELFGIIATCYRARTLFLSKDAKRRAKTAFDRLVQSYLRRAGGKSVKRPPKPDKEFSMSTSNALMQDFIAAMISTIVRFINHTKLDTRRASIYVVAAVAPRAVLKRATSLVITPPRFVHTSHE